MTKRKNYSEPASVYFLKIVLFFILGTVWIRFSTETRTGLGIPAGFLVGIIFANHDHFQIDQKIEYAILLIAAVLSYVFPIGAVIAI